MTNKTNSHRRWLRFSLRSLMLFVLIVTIAGGWFSVRMRKANRQRRAVKSLPTLGIAYDYQVDEHGWIKPDAAPSGSAYLRGWLGDDFFNDVVQAMAYTDAEARFLEQLPQLERVYLVRPTGPHGLWQGIGGTVTDEGLKHVRNLLRVKFLSLSGTQVTDDGLTYIEKLVRLKSLDLTATRITDIGLDHLAQLTQLEELNLEGTRVTDRGLERLRKLRQLKWLNLYGTDVTDAGLVHLESLNELRYLSLAGTNVTDTELHHFFGMAQLDELNLVRTQVSSCGVSTLRQELPDCRIVWLGQSKGVSRQRAKHSPDKSRPIPGTTRTGGRGKSDMHILVAPRRGGPDRARIRIGE